MKKDESDFLKYVRYVDDVDDIRQSADWGGSAAITGSNRHDPTTDHITEPESEDIEINIFDCI